MKILKVTPASPAHQAGLKPGDRLVSIDGNAVEDLLDLRFYLDPEGSALEVERDGGRFQVELQTSPGEDPGWELESLKLRTCHCRCSFCFIDQLPKGLRPGLYLKDEDYRFSFLFGNYLTLVGLKSRDYRRIFELGLSPLYVSIHATDPAVRGRLLGIGKAPILPHLTRLIEGGITLHGQTVLVPGQNDGAVLDETLSELAPLHPGLASLSVVPVGLTKHREDLPEMRLLNRSEAEKTLVIIGTWQEKMFAAVGSRWVYPADELLLLAGADFPADDDYEDYPQIENGVGMVRSLLESASRFLDQAPRESGKKRSLLWVTGESAHGILNALAEECARRIEGLQIVVVEVKNQLMGETVTVANLLCGRNIAYSLRDYLDSNEQTAIDAVYLPPDCVNADGLLLDGWTPANVEEISRLPVQVFDGDWEHMILGGRQK